MGKYMCDGRVMEEKKKEKKKPYKGCKNYRWKSGEFWKPGDKLTETDQKMLLVVQNFYKRCGYTPTRNEIANVGALKQRFRIWDDVLLAAGLPLRNDPENVKKRQEAMAWKERVKSGT